MGRRNVGDPTGRKPRTIRRQSRGKEKIEKSKKKFLNVKPVEWRKKLPFGKAENGLKRVLLARSLANHGEWKSGKRTDFQGEKLCFFQIKGDFPQDEAQSQVGKVGVDAPRSNREFVPRLNSDSDACCLRGRSRQMLKSRFGLLDARQDGTDKLTNEPGS